MIRKVNVTNSMKVLKEEIHNDRIARQSPAFDNGGECFLIQRSTSTCPDRQATIRASPRYEMAAGTPPLIMIMRYQVNLQYVAQVYNRK